MKTPAPVKAWAPVIRSMRSAWIYHMAIRRTRRSSRAAYLDGWDPRFRERAERELKRDQRSGRVRFAKVLVTLATCLAFVLTVRATEPKPITTGKTDLPGTVTPASFDHAPIQFIAPENLKMSFFAGGPYVNLSPSRRIFIRGEKKGKEIVIDTQTGRVTVTGFQDLDEASIHFWKMLEKVFPSAFPQRPQP